MTPAAHHLLRALYLHALAPSTANQDAVRAAGAALDTETARALNGPRDAPNEAATLNAGQILISAVGDDDAQWGWQVWDDVGDLSAEGVVPSLAVALAQVAGVVKHTPRSPAPVDTVVAEVRADLLARSEVGIAKYGVTLDRKDLGHAQWLQHGYEEALDLACYLKRAMRDVTDDHEECLATQGPTAGRHDAEDAIEAGCHAASGREAEWGAREQRIALTAAREAVYNFLERVTAGTTATAPVEPPHAAAPFLATLNPEPTEAVLGRAGDALAWHRQQMPVWVEFEPGVRHPYGDAAFHVAAHVTPDGKARLFPSKTAANVWLCANGRAPV